MLGDAWSSRFAQDMPQSRSGFAFVRGVNLFHLVAIAKAGLVKKNASVYCSRYQTFPFGTSKPMVRILYFLHFGEHGHTYTVIECH